MRRFLQFECEGDLLAATLDEAAGSTGLLIVTGGNEIRAGGFAGQAQLAALVAAQGCPVFRYDRRGTGESEGDNGGFLSSGPDIAAATRAFRRACPDLTRIVAFGNCDAASALMMFGKDADIDAYLLANPWTIEQNAEDTGAAEAEDNPALPPAGAIRARYLDRLKRPDRLLADLFSGRIDLGKAKRGFLRMAGGERASGLASDMAASLATIDVPVTILISRGDMTGQAFMAHWRGKGFAAVRKRTGLTPAICETASHSFAGKDAQEWLRERIKGALDARTA